MIGAEQPPAHVADVAQRLDSAQRTRVAVPQAEPSYDVATAYEIQQALIGRRESRGERVVGTKLGFTSRAKMAQMGVSDLICGVLTDTMQIPSGATVNLSAFLHPRVEPELAFLLRAPLPSTATATGLWQCVEAVAPALEVIDSRYEAFRFSLADVIADNTSASGFVLGEWQAMPAGGLGALGVLLEIDGRAVQIGSTGGILGDPLRALSEAGRLARLTGRELRAGDVVLVGAATAAEPLVPGAHVRGIVQDLGEVSLSVAAD